MFVYVMPHPSHRGFAESISADFWYCYHFTKAFLFKNIVNGILLPKNYDVYLCEGSAPLIPAITKKRFNKNMVIIELIADETFLEMDYKKEDFIKYAETLVRLSQPSSLIGAMLFKLGKFGKELRVKLGARAWLYNYERNVKFIRQAGSKFIDGAIAVSKLAKESAEEFLDVPIRIAHPYIEDEMYERLSEVSPNIESHNVISVGYGKPAKGMDILFDAFRIVKRGVQDAELFIIGKDHPKEWEEIKGIHVLDYVDDLVPYLKNASLFVQSSRSDTFSVATLESLRAGLPTIVTERTGTKEVIENLGKEFVRKADAEDIAKGILHYLDLSGSEKNKLSLKAKELSKKFNKKEMCEMFKREFDLLLEEVR